MPCNTIPAAPLRKAQTLFWLAFGDHGALKTDTPTSAKNDLLLRTTIPRHTHAVQYPRPRPAGEAQMFGWLAFGDHGALKAERTAARAIECD